ncbi:MAG: hypothetical protein Kow0098_20430 [Ignavibacteriaceae bacterium]
MNVNAVFLDRDGTINFDPGYISDPDQIILIPGTAKALSELKSKYDFKLIVVSNQSGIARGIMSSEDVDRVNKRINELLMPEKVQIDDFFYCPAHPDFSTEDECSCRKPSAEMVFKAAEKHNINLSSSYLVGDSVADIECGINAGLKTILVKTGNGMASLSILQNENKFPSFVAEDISEACKLIIKDFSGANK